ncbi:speckle-type POZ [Fusarium sp. NRRL 25303]|nr:speckle-type POZ [Fusarium sp. NRRL 25303]
MASENKTQYYGMLDKSLLELYRTGLYSDLAITCQGNTYRVHKAIVCPRSSFFTAACNGNFKESFEGMINLPDDDPIAVRDMVYYFYNLDLDGHPYIPEDGKYFEEKLSETEYGDEKKQLMDRGGRRFARHRRVKERVLKLRAQISPSSNLRHFAKVYALGEKYGIPGLKTIAVGKFGTLAKAYAQTEDFKFAAQEVYTSTIDQDRRLRDVVVNTVYENLGLLNHEAFAAFVKSCDLGHDVLMKIALFYRAG